MADKISAESTVILRAEYTDGTEKNFTQSNPKSKEAVIPIINALSAFANEKDIFISDNGAAFSRFKAATYKNETTIDYDLG